MVVVVQTLTVDAPAGLIQARKQLTVEQLLPEAAVEAFPIYR
jgi:hypothetical protein